MKKKKTNKQKAKKKKKIKPFIYEELWLKYICIYTQDSTQCNSSVLD